ncbi:nascent polypeptide-associated complex protein [Candidatus Woesearchaeota archaeon]|nr:nascent polypeptide-associated complex protein [Candidatus Woesearchaeota archaeon]
MFPGVNPKQMQSMMRQMGIQQSEIAAVEVIIKTADKEIVIKNPEVIRVKMGGQETFQIGGQITERALEAEISLEDIKTVMEQAGVNENEAKTALQKTKGDLAEAILMLKE